MPLVESYNGSVDLFLVSCISLSYAAGRVLQWFSGFVSSFVFNSSATIPVYTSIQAKLIFYFIFGHSVPPLIPACLPI